MVSNEYIDGWFEVLKPTPHDRCIFHEWRPEDKQVFTSPRAGYPAVSRNNDESAEVKMADDGDKVAVVVDIAVKQVRTQHSLSFTC